MVDLGLHPNTTACPAIVMESPTRIPSESILSRGVTQPFNANVTRIIERDFIRANVLLSGAGARSAQATARTAG